MRSVPRYVTAVVVAAFAATLAWPFFSGPPVAPKLSVCELSRDFRRYDDPVIAVRGVYYQGLRQRCPQTCVTGDPWPSALDLVGDRFPISAVPVRFSTDHQSWDALDKEVLRQAARLYRGEVWVTIVGQLRAGKGSVLGPCDRVAGGHFGHLGTFAAQLVVQRVVEVSVGEASSTGYDYATYLRLAE